MHDQYQLRFESFLTEYIDGLNMPSYKLQEALHYTLNAGGKRLRPLLCYHLADALSLSKDIADYIAVAIELIHTYSLIHDDLPAMDNDDYRRGKPSCHKAFDEATAILTGDGMQPLAYEILLSKLPDLIGASTSIDITRALLHASGFDGMVSGQSLDLHELSNPNLNQDRLQFIHQLKTGKLFIACAEMILLAAQANQQVFKSMRTFATHLGFVFQLQDDYLDAYADIKALGKHRSSDASNKKFTFAAYADKDDLYKKINQQYDLAFEALKQSKMNIDGLYQLTQSMYERTHGTMTDELLL